MNRDIDKELLDSFTEVLLSVRDEKREMQESLEGSDDPHVRLNEPKISIGKVAEGLDFPINEPGGEEEVAKVQNELRRRGWIEFVGEPSTQGMISVMQFTEFGVDQARSFLD